MEQRERLLEIIGGVFSPMTTAEAMERLAEAGIAHAQVNSVLDFIAHPQLSARNRWRDIDSPVGKLSALLPPAEIEGVEPRMGRVPDLGEHNRAILSALGYDEATIRRLREEGVI